MSGNASSTSTSTSSVSGAGGTSGEEIAAARQVIDALDGRIVELIQERMAVSEHVQRVRLASGGRRIDLAREMEILRHYRQELGEPGTRLAMTLLELCRGRA